MIEGGEVKVAGTDRKLAWHEVALGAYTGHNLPDGMEPGLRRAPSTIRKLHLPAGCYICEVEVDPETGKTEIVQFVAADDFGTVVNPMIVEGQVHGGLAQGIGQALLEGRPLRRFGTARDGLLQRLRHAPRLGPADVPGADHRDAVHHQSARHQGLRRGGAIGSPPAVINAITDAIGNNALSMPATPEKVWRALNAVAAKA